MQGAEQGMRIRAMKEEGEIRNEKCAEEWEKSKRGKEGRERWDNREAEKNGGTQEKQERSAMDAQ